MCFLNKFYGMLRRYCKATVENSKEKIMFEFYFCVELLSNHCCLTQMCAMKKFKNSDDTLICIFTAVKMNCPNFKIINF